MKKFAAHGIALALLGCTLEAGPDTAGEGSSGSGPGFETVGSLQQELDVCSCSNSDYTLFQLSSSSSTVNGPSESTHVCWATEIDIEDITDTVDLTVNLFRNSGIWKMRGHGRVECIRQCCFHSNGGSQDVRWLSPAQAALADATSSATVVTKSVDLWRNDAMAIMSSLFHSSAGGFDGAQRAWISQTGSFAKVNSRSSFNGGSLTRTITTGYSFFVGIPSSGHVVRSQTFSLDGPGDIAMMSVSDGICTWSVLNNRIQMQTLNVPRIYRSNGFWRMFNERGQVSSKCFFFGQGQ